MHGKLRTVNGFTIVAHKPTRSRGNLILAARSYDELRIEYVVAGMASLDDSHWDSGYYTWSLTSAVAVYDEYPTLNHTSNTATTEGN